MRKVAGRLLSVLRLFCMLGISIINGWKPRVISNSGNYIAKNKGVHRMRKRTYGGVYLVDFFTNCI